MGTQLNNSSMHHFGTTARCVGVKSRQTGPNDSRITAQVLFARWMCGQNKNFPLDIFDKLEQEAEDGDGREERAQLYVRYLLSPGPARLAWTARRGACIDLVPKNCINKSTPPSSHPEYLNTSLLEE